MVTDAVYPYHLGGKEVRYHQLARGLVRRGVEVHVFTMHWWQGPAHRVDDGVHYHALCRRHRLYRGRRRSIAQAVLFSLACLRLVRYRFDVLEADGMPLLQLFPLHLVAALRRMPLVVTWHEFWGRETWRRYLGAAGQVAAFVERRAVRIGDVLVTPSPGTGERLIAQGISPRRVRLVPNGIDLDVLDSVPPSPLAFDLLFVGRLIEHKHVDLLLMAIAELQRAGRAVSCGVVGDGPERAALETLAERLGVDGVRFLGALDDQAGVYGLMKAARVFVLPSTREGYGIVVAEAIACGLLVVTSDHPDNHARHLVEPGVTGWRCDATVPALAAAIARALSCTPGTTAPPTAAPPPGVRRAHGWAESVELELEVFASAVDGPGRG